MSLYTHIKRCLELSDRDIATAIADRRLAKALLDQLAKVSRPGDGVDRRRLALRKRGARAGAPRAAERAERADVAREARRGGQAPPLVGEAPRGEGEGPLRCAGRAAPRHLAHDGQDAAARAAA